MSEVSRRKFLKASGAIASGIIISSGVTSLTGCNGEGLVPAYFTHGVASGDPLSDRVILWTRVYPEKEKSHAVRVFWEVARDELFEDIVSSGSGLAVQERDFTLKVDVLELDPDTSYFYRFSTVNDRSLVGRTRTLPTGEVDSLQFAVVSCSNYPVGYFHVYSEIAKIPDLNAVLHLGDYIYELERGGFASEDATTLNREVNPPGELLSLQDYRTRYAQYRSDKDLQACHAAHPIIAIWDDHEVANDAWKSGARGHDGDTEGDFATRLLAALQAYAEWLPIRPAVDTDVGSLYRNFEFGDLLNLSMLDTRLVGRDRQLSLSSYFNEDGTFDSARFDVEVNSDRTLLGIGQKIWLKEQLVKDHTWQLIGQQVLMGRMELPGAIATLQLSVSAFAELAEIAQIAQSDPSILTEEQLAFLNEKGHLLELPYLPYNLDAWDGYQKERSEILDFIRDSGQKVVTIAGDTHNAWANNLSINEATVAVEFATCSVSSPGVERALELDTPEKIVGAEAGVVQLIENCQYTNLANRGFLKLSFTKTDVTANWKFVSTVKETEYQLLADREKTISVAKIDLDV